METTRCDRLLIAAGGGGDALAAAIVHRKLCGDGHTPHIATYSWDRLMVDPVPGPRDPSWFEHVEPFGNHNVVVTEASTVRPPGASLLPRLSGALSTPFYLLDPRAGAVGMRTQLAELVRLLHVDQVSVVDVGGDILVRGDEPELRSPLADSLVLAAAHDIGTPVDVLVTGEGLDGELAAEHVRQIATDLHGELAWLRLSDSDVEGYRPLLDWHPSEATGLLILAVLGLRGMVETRDAGLPVELTATSEDIHRCQHTAVFAHNRFAMRMSSSTTMAGVEETIEAFGRRSEISYECEKAAARRYNPGAPRTPPTPDEAIRTLLDYSHSAHRRGIAALTLRRIAELLGIDSNDLTQLAPDLERHFGHRFQPPLLSTGTTAPTPLRL